MRTFRPEIAEFDFTNDSSAVLNLTLFDAGQTGLLSSNYTTGIEETATGIAVDANEVVYASGNNTLVCVDEDTMRINVFNATSYALLFTSAVLNASGSSWRLTYNSIDNTTYIFDHEGEEIHVYNNATTVIDAVIAYACFENGGGTFKPSSNTIYIGGAAGAGGNAEIDCDTNTVANLFSVGLGTSFAYNSTSDKLYWTKATVDEGIQIWDASASPPTLIIEYITDYFVNPGFCVVDTVNNKIWFTITDGGSIQIYDGVTNALDTTIAAGTLNNPDHLLWYPAESVVLAWNAGEPGADMYALNTANYTVNSTLTFELQDAVSFGTYDTNAEVVFICNRSTTGFVYQYAFASPVEVSSAINYDDFNESLNNNPKRILKLTIQSSETQLNEIMPIKKTVASGFIWDYNIYPGLHISPWYKQFKVELEPYRPLILNGQTVINAYPLGVGETVKIVLYYIEIDKSKGLYGKGLAGFKSKILPKNI